MSFDAAYEALTDHDDDARWAYGTGFADPLAGVATAVPAGVDRADLAAYCLMLGDDALIMSHRLQQWVTRAPELEDELAIANIGLDLLGQARLLLTRAGEVEERRPRRGRPGLPARRRPTSATCGWPSAPTTTSPHLVARLLVFATWRLALLDRLTASARPGAGRDRREGRQGADLPPRVRGPVGGPARRRHRAVPRPHAGRVDAVWPLTAELFQPARDRAAPGRGRRRRSTRRRCARSSTPCWPRSAGRDPAADAARQSATPRRQRTRVAGRRRSGGVARRSRAVARLGPVAADGGARRRAGRDPRRDAGSWRGALPGGVW